MHVVQINGDQDKHEKFAYTKLFTDSIKMNDYNPRVLVATAAANTGIDQVLVKWVLTVGLPRCLTTLLQERGRSKSWTRSISHHDGLEVICEVDTLHFGATPKKHRRSEGL